MSTQIPPTSAPGKDPCRTLTPTFRVSFPHVFNPKAGQPDPTTGAPRAPKYQITMLYTKATDLGVLRSAANAALVKKFGPKGPFPKELTVPWKDGDLKDYQGFAGCIYVEASTSSRPQIVGVDLTAITSEDDFYPGCYARASVTAAYYEVMSPDGRSVLKRGVKFYLNNLQKMLDGEGFVNRANAVDEFAGAPGTVANPNTAVGEFALTPAATGLPSMARPTGTPHAEDSTPF